MSGACSRDDPGCRSPCASSWTAVPGRDTWVSRQPEAGVQAASSEDSGRRRRLRSTSEVCGPPPRRRPTGPGPGRRHLARGRPRGLRPVHGWRLAWLGPVVCSRRPDLSRLVHRGSPPAARGPRRVTGAVAEIRHIRAGSMDSSHFPFFGERARTVKSPDAVRASLLLRYRSGQSRSTASGRSGHRCPHHQPHTPQGSASRVATAATAPTGSQPALGRRDHRQRCRPPRRDQPRRAVTLDSVCTDRGSRSSEAPLPGLRMRGLRHDCSGRGLRRRSGQAWRDGEPQSVVGSQAGRPGAAVAPAGHVAAGVHHSDAWEGIRESTPAVMRRPGGGSRPSARVVPATGG